jgi:hypothetical protein
VFLLAIDAAVIIGRRQPEPNAIIELSKCKGVMCFLGILPQQTTLRDAQAAIKNSAQFRFSSPSNKNAQRLIEPGYTVELYQGGATSLVDGVILGFPIETRVNVGIIVTQLGPPCRIRRNMQGLGLVYPGMVLFTWSQPLETQWVLRPELTINQISIVDTGTFCGEAITDPNVFEWHGFGRY